MRGLKLGFSAASAAARRVQTLPLFGRVAVRRGAPSMFGVAPLNTTSSVLTASIGARRFKSCAIVGLPNVGKSTLFNALTKTQMAEAANYPFCTIEPNTATVAIVDPRLRALAAVAKSQKIIEAQLSITDVAGA